MKRYQRRVRVLAAGLSALAGFVDATGFIGLGGFFVSFMSGNTTRFAVGLARGTDAAALAAGLIAAFVLGVMIGTLLRRQGTKRRAARVLLLVAVLLMFAAIFGTHGFPTASGITMALAMGAENAVFEREGEVHIGLTYMTGTLVKLGQHLTRALCGEDGGAWRSYLLLWLGLAGGATAGAVLHPWLGLGGLWLAAATAALFAMAVARMEQFE
ncbi:MAG TPA: YoaK family protein [Rhizomicrobium sp.]|nr:YoaK family protein [Rhizomicrobium sp.]